MPTPVRKAVFPVAGLGTRFLPVTKANPKEMLPVVDKPLIQYAVEEAAAAGAEVMIFVTGRNKGAIKDHFDRAEALESELEAKGNSDLLEIARATSPSGVSFVYAQQQRALGLGHAVLCARDAVGDEPFFVVLPDDLIQCDGDPCLVQMREAYARSGIGSVAVEEIPREETGHYGIVQLGDGDRIQAIVEKPPPEEAPSNLGVVGRYLLPPTIWPLLERTGKGAGGEIQLTDAIARLLEHEPLQAFRFRGTRYDCGSKLGYLKANVDYGLVHPETSDAFSVWLNNIINKQ